MSRQRRNFSAKFKSDLVIELLKGEKDLNTLAVENNIQLYSTGSRICSATGKKNFSTTLLLYLMTNVRITSKKSLPKNARKKRSMPKRLVS